MTAGEARVTFTLDGFRRGVAMAAMMAPSVFAFAAAMGAVAVQKGLTLLDTVLMSFIVYAGSSQMVALEVWPREFTLATLLAVVGVTAVVNSRLILMSAALRPWIGGLPPAVNYTQLFFLTDANYILAMRHRQEGGTDVGVLVGAGVLLWLVWIAGTVPGHVLGALVAQPRAFALDLIMPVYFAVIAVPLWRGAADTRPWLVAAAVALLVHALVPGHWHIVAGAVAGMLFAAFDPWVAEPAA